MNKNEKRLELLALLNLNEVDVAGERLQRWASAFQDWIEERRARFHPSVAADSCTAWKQFLALTRKPPWEASVPDVEAYVEALQKRKLRPATVKVRLAGLTKFYEYCQAHQIDAECEAGFNPVASVRRPKEVKYEKANYLSRKEEAALLDAIRRDPSPMGKRDYALILMLLRTGWKAGEVRQLRWRELGSRGAAAENAAGEPGSTGGGERGRWGLPGEVWEAVKESLEATGRWEGMQAEAYVFAPSRAALVREARERPEDWDGSRPLSHDELLRLVRLHAGRAGLKAEKITCHTLRHTAAMRQVEAGASPEAVGALLGRKGPAEVKRYLRRLAKRPKGRLRAPKRVDPATGELVPPGSEEIPSRAPFRAGPRNHLGLKHGFYAKYLPEFEWLAEEGIEPQGMDRAVMRWRIVMRRVMIVGADVDNLKDAMRYLKIIGYASVRLCKALKFRQQMRDLQVELRRKAFFRRK